MSRQTKRTIVLAVGIVFVVMLITGCEEELSNVKRHRLIAVENTQLKKQLAQLEVEIERQKKLHNTEIEKQKKLLERCEGAKKVIEEQSAEDAGDLFDGMWGDVIEESKALREENKKLKARVQQLETIIQQLGKEPSKIEEPPTPQPL